MKKRVLAVLLAVCLIISTGITLALAKSSQDTYAKKGDKISSGWGNANTGYSPVNDTYENVKKILDDHETEAIEATNYVIEPQKYAPHDPNEPAVILDGTVKKIDNSNVREYFKFTPDLDDEQVIVESEPFAYNDKNITIHFDITPKNKANGDPIVPNRENYIYEFVKDLKDEPDPTQSTDDPDDDYVECKDNLVKDSDVNKTPFFSFTYKTKQDPNVPTLGNPDKPWEFTLEIRKEHPEDGTVYGEEYERFDEDLAGKTYGEVGLLDNEDEKGLNGDYYAIMPYFYTLDDHKPMVKVGRDVTEINNDNVSNYLAISDDLPDNGSVIVTSGPISPSDQTITIRFAYDDNLLDIDDPRYFLLNDLKDEVDPSDSTKYIDKSGTKVTNGDYDVMNAYAFLWVVSDPALYKTDPSATITTFNNPGTHFMDIELVRSLLDNDPYGNKGDVFTQNLAGKTYLDVKKLKDADKNIATTNTTYTIAPKAEAFAIQSDVLTITKHNVNHYFDLSDDLQKAIANDTICVLGVFGPYDETVNVKFYVNPTKVLNTQTAYRLTKTLTDYYDSDKGIYVDRSSTVLVLDTDPNDGVTNDYEVITVYDGATYKFNCEVVNSAGKWHTETSYDEVIYTVNGVSRNPQPDPIGGVKIKWNLWENLRNITKWTQGFTTFVLRTLWEPIRWLLSFVVDIEPIF